MKRIGILSMAFAAMLTVACGGGRDDRNNPNNDNAAVGTAGEGAAANANADRANANDNKAVSDRAQDWVKDQLMGGMAEVKLGELASTKAQNADVKAFGRMMVQDHTKAGNQLKQLASQQNIQPPTDLDQDHRDQMDKLSKLSGAEFDREYMQTMVDDHEKDLDNLEERVDKKGDDANATFTAKQTDDQFESKLNQWAADAAPVVNKHLQRAKQLNDKLGRRTTDDNR
jgi:putative membrane protein